VITFPGKKAREALEARSRLIKGRTIAPRKVEERWSADVDGLVLPVRLPPVVLFPVFDFERRSYLTWYRGDAVVIHDESFAETIHFLEIAHIGEDRPLVTWAVLGLVLSELLYSGTLPAMGIYFAARMEEHADRFRDEDGRFARPIIIPDASPDTPVDLLPGLLRRIEERKTRHMRLQRLLILFHEIGHVLWNTQDAWRESWTSAEPSLIGDPFFLADPVAMDQEGGLQVTNRLSAEEHAERSRRLMAEVVEEIACDSFALLALGCNLAVLGLAWDEAVRVMGRFLLFTDLIADIRRQAEERARNRIRFRSITTRLALRSAVLQQLLQAPERFPALGMLDPESTKALAALADMDPAVYAELREAVRVAGHLMTWAVGGPAPWESSLHYGRVPSGYLAGVQGKEDLERRIRDFAELFGDDYLAGWEEPPDTRVAPAFRAAGYLLSRSRSWANDYFAQPDKHAPFEEVARSVDRSRQILSRTFNNVLRDEMKPIPRPRTS